MTNAYRDENDVPTLIGVSSVDGFTPTRWKINPSTGRALVDVSGGSSGITSINADTTAAQFLVTGTTGTDFAIVDNGTGTHTFNLPTASASNRGALSSTDWSTFNGKGAGTVTSVSGTTNRVTSTGGTTPAIDVSATFEALLGKVASPLSQFASTTSAQLAGVISDETGSGSVVFATSPTLVSPVLGAATATSINGNVLTTGSSTYTGTAGQTYTFPSTSATLARTDAANTFTGVQTTTQIISTSNAITATSNAATVPVTSKVNTVTNSSAATLTITMTTTGAVDGQTSIVRILDFSGVTETITWVNTENSTVSAPTTSNGSTTLPLTVGFMYNNATSKWRCVASA